jgi:peptide/nickel transport system substrate-binding protein
MVVTSCRGSSERPAGTERGTASAAPARGGELVASMRSEPAGYNRYVASGTSAAADFLTLLTHGRLVRVNRATDQLEPWLAESWTQSADGLTYTIKLRRNVVFSDGAPFTADDVLFSFRTAYDSRLKSPLESALQVGGKPLDVTAPDRETVVVRFPSRFGPGLRLLDNLPVLPKHKLEAALNAGKLPEEWTPSKPLTDITGLGPFVLTEHVAGQRLVLSRNAHYFRRDASGTQLPYLDKLTILIIPDQAAEALRLQAGEIDLMANGEIRPQDYSAFRRLSDSGALRLIEAGTGLDPDLLWFNLTASRTSSHAPWLSRREFRQAISYAVDRQAIVNGVYLGAAVPIHGPVSPGNTTWHSASAPTYPHDVARARQLLSSIGLSDRNGDGMLEDEKGTPVRFSMLTQAGHIRGRTAAVLQEQLRQIGIAVDLVTLDPPGIVQRWSKSDYDSIYFGVQASSTDPALNPEFWLSSGEFHFWNPRQPSPQTDWEKRIDELMHEQAAASDLAGRQRAFAEVQRIVGEELPAIYFVAPKVTLATTTRVTNATPALQLPQLLWSADSLAVTRQTR